MKRWQGEKPKGIRGVMLAYFRRFEALNDQNDPLKQELKPT